MTTDEKLMPDTIYVAAPGILHRHIGGREGRWTEWIPSEGDITKYTRAKLAPRQPVEGATADALQRCLDTMRLANDLKIEFNEAYQRLWREIEGGYGIQQNTKDELERLMRHVVGGICISGNDPLSTIDTIVEVLKSAIYAEQPAPVDIEKLKREGITFASQPDKWTDDNLICAFIDHLAASGHLAGKVQNVATDQEVREYCLKLPLNELGKKSLDELYPPATAAGEALKDCPIYDDVVELIRLHDAATDKHLSGPECKALFAAWRKLDFSETIKFFRAALSAPVVPDGTINMSRRTVLRLINILECASDVSKTAGRRETEKGCYNLMLELKAMLSAAPQPQDDEYIDDIHKQMEINKGAG